jgi:hypothetical protein
VLGGESPAPTSWPRLARGPGRQGRRSRPLPEGWCAARCPARCRAVHRPDRSGASASPAAPNRRGARGWPASSGNR